MRCRSASVTSGGRPPGFCGISMSVFMRPVSGALDEVVRAYEILVTVAATSRKLAVAAMQPKVDLLCSLQRTGRKPHALCRHGGGGMECPHCIRPFAMFYTSNFPSSTRQWVL